MNETKVPWKIGDVVIALILFFPVLIGATLIIRAALTPILTRGAPVIAFLTGYVLILLLVWYFALARRDASWSTLGFRSFDVSRGLGLAVVWFFLVRIITAIYAILVEQIGIKPPEDMLEQIPELFGRDTLGFVLAFIVVVVAAPVIEELFFRGFIYPAFRERWGITAGIIVSGLLFAIFHFNLYVFVPIAVVGFALAYLYERTGSLGPPIMLHAINNLISVVLIYYGGDLLVSG